MPPPSQLAIATSVVTRLVKEEASYHKELEQQKARIAKLEANNGDEYELKQEKQALQETHAVFPRLKTQISQAVEKLEAQIEQGKAQGAPAEEVEKANEAVQVGKNALSEIGGA